MADAGAAAAAVVVDDLLQYNPGEVVMENIEKPEVLNRLTKFASDLNHSLQLALDDKKQQGRSRHKGKKTTTSLTMTKKKSTTETQVQKYPLLTKFWKRFGDQGIFLGTIVQYFEDTGEYRCYYEDDGDVEDLLEEEINEWIEKYKHHPVVVAATTTTTTSAARSPQQPQYYPLGTKFWKNFGKHGIFLGTVVQYFPEDNEYRCHYDGDGDVEDLTQEDICAWLKRYPSARALNKHHHQTAADEEEEEKVSQKNKKASPNPPTSHGLTLTDKEKKELKLLRENNKILQAEADKLKQKVSKLETTGTVSNPPKDTTAATTGLADEEKKELKLLRENNKILQGEAVHLTRKVNKLKKRWRALQRELDSSKKKSSAAAAEPNTTQTDDNIIWEEEEEKDDDDEDSEPNTTQTDDNIIWEEEEEKDDDEEDSKPAAKETDGRQQQRRLPRFPRKDYANMAGEADTSPSDASGRRVRCGSCQGCTRKECGVCENCHDMPKFGGENKKRKACIHRTCQNMSYSRKAAPTTPRGAIRTSSRLGLKAKRKTPPQSTSTQQVPTTGAGQAGQKPAAPRPAQEGTAAAPEDTDPDGSLRIPGYRGVWVNPKDKHFVKYNRHHQTLSPTTVAAVAPPAATPPPTTPVVCDGPMQEGAPTPQEKDRPEDEDPHGSLRIPGYGGDWLISKGKYFVKLNNTILKVPGGDQTLFFDSIEEAAKGHDKAVKDQGNDPTAELNFEKDGTRIVYRHTQESANNVVKALSVINIKDLPADVKPLLSDPRKARGGGSNAYRGVCRQVRVGRYRWQSQISFMGNNYYLGTFDSEWDAAAIYGWAHLILYGEEATRNALKEGEEAVTTTTTTTTKATKTKKRKMVVPASTRSRKATKTTATSTTTTTTRKSYRSRNHCGNCEGCLRKDCGKCINCLDKPKFGGDNTRKRACLHRKCVATQQSKEAVEGSPESEPNRTTKTSSLPGTEEASDPPGATIDPSNIYGYSNRQISPSGTDDEESKSEDEYEEPSGRPPLHRLMLDYDEKKAMPPPKPRSPVAIMLADSPLQPAAASVTQNRLSVTSTSKGNVSFSGQPSQRRPVRKWSPEEDELLRKAVHELDPTGSCVPWSELKGRIPNRDTNRCRERWENTLDPKVNHGPWTKEEDQLIRDLHKQHGWTAIARQMGTGRTGPMVNRRATQLKVKQTRNADPAKTTSIATANDVPAKINDVPAKITLTIPKNRPYPAPYVGPGWTIELVPRKGGKLAGRSDKYWYSPGKKKFRSKAEIDRFKAALSGLIGSDKEGNEDAAWSIIKGSSTLKRERNEVEPGSDRFLSC